MVYSKYRCYLNSTGMPQYIKGSFTYDPEIFSFVENYPDFAPEGFVFPLASSDFEEMYDLTFSVEEGTISFEYTLKPGYNEDDMFDCLDRLSMAEKNSISDHDISKLHIFPLVDMIAEHEYDPWNSKVFYHFTLLDEVNTDGTVQFENGTKYGYVGANVQGYTVKKPDPPVSVISQQKELLLSQYQIADKQLVKYEAIYDHKGQGDTVDWALVRAYTNESEGAPAYYELGNRVLCTDNAAFPFSFRIGIYNVKRGRFFDITECRAEDYPDLETVWMELGDGRLIGDMDGDNSLTVSDAAIIQRCAADIMPYPEDDANPAAESNPDAIKYFSDFDVDGDRGIVDATMIQRYIADMPYRTAEWSPYEEPVEPMHEPDDLSIPRITGFRSLGKGIEISIDPIPGAEKYRFYFKNKNGNWEKMGETTGAPFVSTNAVEVGKTYTYTVRCIKADLSSFTSDYYKTGWSYTYDPQLDTPRITRAEAVNEGVKVTWKPVEGADLYRLYLWDGGNWTKLADTRDTSYVYQTTLTSHTFLFTVRCLSKGGSGFASEYDHKGYSFYMDETGSLEDYKVYADGIYLKVPENEKFKNRKAALYRQETSGWKRIATLPSGGSYLDRNVVAGKIYYYTVRWLSEDGSYFVSQYKKYGTPVEFYRSRLLLEVDYFMDFGDNNFALCIMEGDKFDYTKVGVDVYDYNKFYGSFTFNKGEICYLNDKIFRESNDVNVKLYGLDKNDQVVTYQYPDKIFLNRTGTPSNLRVKKLGDRKYRFRWDSGTATGYYFDMGSVDGKFEIDSDYLQYQYFDVDLSDYPEDAVWEAFLFGAREDMICYSAPIMIEFRESDYNSETE